MWPSLCRDHAEHECRLIANASWSAVVVAEFKSSRALSAIRWILAQLAGFVWFKLPEWQVGPGKKTPSHLIVACLGLTPLFTNGCSVFLGHYD